MIYGQLFWAFFKIGLFAVGGGLATIPFLMDLSQQTQWFSIEELTQMIAISESTPGPLGVNMATFVGIQVAGIAGGLIATLGLICPMLLAIILLSHVIQKLSKNSWMEAVFHGFRIGVIGMILAFVYKLLCNIFSLQHLDLSFGKTSLIIAIYFLMTFNIKMHPLFFILIAAVIGMLYVLI